MSFDIAKRAIDFYIQHSERNDHPVITFYGGEPLCNFDLVKRCIEYSKPKTTKNIIFAITTNGTLLTPEIFDYLSKNGCLINVSLDGPNDIHDRYRVFSSGNGTHSTIIKNLKRISLKEISFNITISPPYEFERIKDYFDSLGLGEREYMRVALVAKEDSSLFPCDNKVFFRELNSQITVAREEFKKDLINGTENRSLFLKSFFEKDLLAIRKRGIFERFDEFHYPNRICTPGKRKLFVDVNGDFFICENMTDFRPIGNVFIGFDYAEIFKILDEYIKYCNIDCLSCWAIRLCDFCFVTMKKGHELDFDRKRKKCKAMKEWLEIILEFYLEVLERNPNAFDFMDKILYMQ
jgi:uncharacterized protein